MNINEIAKLAGVSRATVSRYLNQGYVSTEKKDAIRKVIEETGYEPSQQAQNLRKKVTRLIGVIIPRIQSESVSHMVEGISHVLAKEDYQLLLANTQNNEEEEMKYLKVFRKNQVDGIIYMGTTFTKEHISLMEEVEVPMVIMGQQISHFSCVYQDDYHAAYDAAKRLLASGTKIGYLGVTTKDKAAGASRKKGYVDAVKEVDGEVDQKLMREADFGVDAGYAHAKALLEEAPDLDSIFCATDSIAVGALKYLQEHKIAVPGQVQLIGFGNTVMGSVVSPSVTSVQFFYESSGEEAARLLLEILGTGEDQKREIKMGYKFVEKASIRYSKRG